MKQQATFAQTAKTASAAVKEYAQNPYRLDKELMKCAAKNEFISTADGAQSVRAVSKHLMQFGDGSRRNGFSHALFEKDSSGRFVKRVRVTTLPLVEGPDGLEVAYYFKNCEYVTDNGAAYRLAPIPMTLCGFFAAYCAIVREQIAAEKAARRAAEKAAKDAKKTAQSGARRLKSARKDICNALSRGAVVPAEAIERMTAIDALLNEAKAV